MIRILGAVLAGGRSSRFGSDKALATWRDTALIDHALDSLSPHVADLLVVGRPDARARTAPDLPHPDLGPLGGIAGALAVAARDGFDAVLTTACDTPLLPAALVAALLAQEVAYATEAPTVGLWPARLAAPLVEHLSAGGDRSIRRWARAAGAVAVLPGVVLANVNTPDDLARLGVARG